MNGQPRVFIEKEVSVFQHQTLIPVNIVTRDRNVKEVTAECITPEGYSKCACGIYDLFWEIR